MIALIFVINSQRKLCNISSILKAAMYVPAHKNTFVMPQLVYDPVLII